MDRAGLIPTLLLLLLGLLGGIAPRAGGDTIVGQDDVGNMLLNASTVFVGGVDLVGELNKITAAHAAMKADLATLRAEVARLRPQTRLLLIGGDGVCPSCILAFNGSAWNTSALPPLPLLPSGGLLRFPAAAVYKGQIYVTGGNANTPPLNTTRIYNGATWVVGPPLVIPREKHSMVVYNNGLMVIGGLGLTLDVNLNYHSTVEILDPTTGSWSILGTVLVGRSAAAAAVYTNRVFLTGGDIADTAPTASIEMYNGISWSMGAAMNAPRSNHAVAVYQNELYAVGGFDGNSPVSTVERFDGAAWTVLPAGLYDSRQFFGLGVASGSMFAIGGTVESFDPKVVERYSRGKWVIEEGVMPMPNSRFGFAMVEY